MTELRTAAVPLCKKSLSMLLAREVGYLHTAEALFKGLKMCDRDGKFPVWIWTIPSCRPSARSSRALKCDVDIRNDLRAKVVLSDGVALSKGYGEEMAKECSVSCANEFLLSVTVSVYVSLGSKLAQLRRSVGMHMDLTLLHSCTCVSFVTELLCAHDHSSNAFALAQMALQNRLSFDIIAQR